MIRCFKQIVGYGRPLSFHTKFNSVSTEIKKGRTDYGLPYTTLFLQMPLFYSTSYLTNDRTPKKMHAHLRDIFQGHL